jgi:DMSO/TMAO reductase YedYZ molybdopterin-dependent catalytic subunit
MEHGAISMAEWTGARLADVLEAAGLHHDEDLHVAFAAPTWLRKLGRSSNVGTK